MYFKKIKNIVHYTVIFALAVSVAGCKKWLDVNPATRVSEDEQFSSQQGFIDALFGTYQKMATEEAYGRLGTYGFVDVLAQLYENKSPQISAWYGQTARYVYTSASTSQQNVQGSINSIWSNYYATIAQANYILKNIESKNVVSGTAYNIIKGEALAIRGMIHFDLARLFAPAWLNGQNAAAVAIPYMEDFSINPQQKLSLEAVLKKCETDLKDAESLLEAHKDIDQIAENQGSTSLDLFLMYRQNHLNYWAVKGILARLYLYKGDKLNALKYSTEVIDSEKFSFISSGSLSVDALTTTSDLTFTPEHLFSLNVTNLKKAVDIYFKSSQTGAADATDLFSTKANLTTYYETSLIGYGTDIRNPDASKSLWNQHTSTIVYSKKYYSDNETNVKQRLVPIIRLPEMYYIAAEAAPTLDQGLTYLNKVRVARLIPELTTTTVPTTTLLQDEIFKEYRKELYGEGQLWFYYKRNNVTTIPTGAGNPMTQEKYTLPLPLNEIEFGL